MDINKIEWFLALKLEKIVLDVRKELKRRYPHNGNLTGLCDTATLMIIERVRNRDFLEELDIEICGIHGELSHTPMIPSRSWVREHTMCTLHVGNLVYYIDATCEQFRDISEDIPKFYISKDMPKWFYPDECNIRWNKLFNFINEHVYVKKTVEYNSDKLVVKCGIVEILQYDVWGHISDLIRKVLYKDRG